MTALEDVADEVAARTGFSGVVRVDRAGSTELARAYGLADRAHDVPMTVGTRLAMASGTKGFTALAVMSLVGDGTLALATTARSLLGDDLPMIADDVTVEHLLAHRSGIGDYVDEESGLPIGAYLMPVPVHRLDTAEAFLEVLDGFPTVFRAGERFTYNNGGYVVLALLAERASGVPYHDLVEQRVLGPAGLADTGFLRLDSLPGRTATGYVEVAGTERTNVLHLPVRGVGDCGAYSTAADVHAFWQALFAGAVVPPATLAEMVRPRDTGEPERRYGLGFWVYPAEPTPDAVELEGYDAGVSFRTRHVPSTGLTCTVVGNTSEGAWPVWRALAPALAGGPA